MKRCNKCGLEKDESEFRVRKKQHGKIYFRSQCKACDKEYYENHKQKPEVAERMRAISYKREYGITIEDYNKLFNEQGGRCKICNRHQSELDKRLFVDHNHETGETRGLLCRSCNSAIGLFRDDKELLLSACSYLESYS